MSIEYDEKGKIFTDVVSKTAIHATIQTTTHLLQGYIHVRRDQRIKDELDRDKGSSLTPAQREQARQLLNQRDDIITLLARSDPASSKKLADLYVAFRKSVAGAPAETK